MERIRESPSRNRRMRVLTFIAGWGSLLDLWPAVKYEEVYPHKAEDILRRSMEGVSGAFWTAFDEVMGEQKEGKEQAEAQAVNVEESTADEPFARL